MGNDTTSKGNAKHTPGRYVLVVRNTGEVLGFYPTHYDADYDLHHSTYTPEQLMLIPASVFAAAPELLEALREMLEIHLGDGHTAGDCLDCVAHKKAIAAIAKAEGR